MNSLCFLVCAVDIQALYAVFIMVGERKKEKSLLDFVLKFCSVWKVHS